MRTPPICLRAAGGQRQEIRIAGVTPHADEDVVELPAVTFVGETIAEAGELEGVSRNRLLPTRHSARRSPCSSAPAKTL